MCEDVQYIMPSLIGGNVVRQSRKRPYDGRKHLANAVVC